jgi:hypothetical protein
MDAGSADRRARRFLRTVKSCGPVVQHFFARQKQNKNSEETKGLSDMCRQRRRPAPNEAGPNRP